VGVGHCGGAGSEVLVICLHRYGPYRYKTKWRNNITVADARREISDPALRPIKVLYSHRTQSRDGQSVHIQELIKALRALGHEVIVVEPGHVKSLKFGDESRASQVLKKYVPRHIYELMEIAYSVPEFISLAAACRAHRPDVLYQRANLYMLSGPICARVFGLPYLLEVNAPLTEERGRFGDLSLPGLAWFTERAAWRAADQVLPVTQVLARNIERAGISHDRVTVIPNGVDLERFAPGNETELRHKLSLDGKLVLGFVGFVREWHHADTIIDLLGGPGLPANCHFLIVGDGPVKGQLQEQARQLGVLDRLTITGVVPREDVASYIRCFDVALQPHVVAYASPLKLLEYMALARAIVAPATDNVRELLVHGENAFLVEPNDRIAYATAVGRLVGDEKLRRRLGSAARQTVLARDLTWSRNARTVAELAQILIKRKHINQS
jgi:glycosyltransferase involved in cell wall biosynthesis